MVKWIIIFPIELYENDILSNQKHLTSRFDINLLKISSILSIFLILSVYLNSEKVSKR